MTPTPHFRSHAEQQAVLGCAAQLDPLKHPRRFARQQAREKFIPPKRIQQPASVERTPALLEKASALTHLNITEAARQLGVSRSVLERLRSDYGLTFATLPRRNAAARLKELAPAHSTLKGLAEAAGLSYPQTYKLCKRHGIEPGVPYGQAPKGS
ncbi:hypothetical protein [Pseudomonas sp. UBA7530]|uniref:hypothetical protein n=1 Tax=Pseudomonas sp. UBA7530 TaxID=1947341 RepID=UPI0025EC6836|nr:hypothetical protein [Pseudomonas sp. UBA7530]